MSTFGMKIKTKASSRQIKLLLPTILVNFLSQSIEKVLSTLNQNKLFATPCVGLLFYILKKKNSLFFGMVNSLVHSLKRFYGFFTCI